MKSLLDSPIATHLSRKPRRLRARPRRFNRILVPIDFSCPSLKAIPYALAIARFGSDVHLLHVVDTTEYPPPTLLTLPLVPQAEWNRRLMKQLHATAGMYDTRGGGIHVLKLREGRAYEEICAAARRLNADLVVIATHGYTGYEHMFLGSTAERVVQHARCPVLVVRLHARHWEGVRDPRTRKGFQLAKILVPTDFSECSQAGFEYGVQLARDFKADLHLVHVINQHAYPFGDKYAALDEAQLTRETEDAAQKQLRRMGAKTGVRYSAEVRRGSSAIEICKAANEDFDLIVTSTHGRTGLSHVLIGSTAERILRYARCPVLVIPARPKSGERMTAQFFNRAEASARATRGNGKIAGPGNVRSPKKVS
jgi:nucleotide-binding universal stress UspA family protein